jgi:para-nitrobenzyl esterase
MSTISRKQFLKSTAMGVGSVIILPGFDFQVSDSKISYVYARTEMGRIRGTRENGVNIYKGIPYAGRVSGDR